MTREFGRTIEHYRSQIGIKTQRELARRAECDTSTITRIEDGSRNPGTGLTLDLMDALEVPVGERANFLLLAAGYDSDTIQDALGTRQAFILPTVTLSQTPEGWVARFPQNVRLAIEDSNF